MQQVDFGREQGRWIEQHGSAFVLARLARTERLHVACMYLEPGGCVGRHPTAKRQLFAVVQGEGWAAGGDGERVALRAGTAVVWDAGESHEAGTDTGLVAIVIESDLLADDPRNLGPRGG